MAIDGFARSEIFYFEKLAQLDFAILSFVRSRRALGPFQRFFAGFYLNDPVTGDQLLGFREWSVDNCDALAVANI